MDPERIFRGNKTPIKKFNIYNPANIFLEILNTEEDLKENHILLIFLQRDFNNKSYRDAKEIIFEFTQFAGSDQLFKLCREVFKLSGDFRIAKYARHYYTWEEIKEKDSKNNPINLRKGPYNLKDGDWIGISFDPNDDFMTIEDSRMAEVVKTSTTKGPRKRRLSGKLLRIVTDF
jgi:hypothetical protein